MATLVRVRQHDDDDIQNRIPSPFPVQQLLDIRTSSIAVEQADYDDTTAARIAQCRDDIQASVSAVHHSCLMTLANIFSFSSPSVLHADSSDHDIPLAQVLAESPLSCLVHALRARYDYPHPDHPPSEAALLSQLRDLVDAIAPSLGRPDAHLAQALVALLIDLEQLPASLALTSAQLLSPSDGPSQHAGPSPPSPYATIASLQRQLSSLQPSIASASSTSRLTPAESVQTALLWARIDEQLETIVSLCRARASSLPQPNITESTPSGLVTLTSVSRDSNNNALRPSFDDALPPDYDSDWHHYSNECPPYIADGYSYTSSAQKSTDENRSIEQYPQEKVSSPLSTSALLEDTETATEDHPAPSNSLDLDAVTHAIERLYVVAPQLANQRVELRREKLVQMEKARQGKGKVHDIADPELDKILDLLGRASAREIPDQSVVIDPHRTAREMGAADIEEQRRKYLEHIVHRTATGRLHSQDAVLSKIAPSSTGGSVQVENHSLEVQLEDRSSRDDKRASYPSTPKSGSTLQPPTDRSRNRSLSAPHLAWLRPRDKSGNANGSKESLTRTLSSDPKNASPSATSKSTRSLSVRIRGVSKSRPSSAGEDVSLGALDITYVAEHHETLKHVLVFIACASGSLLGGVPLAEVLPGTSSGTHGDCLFLRLGGTPSPPLVLPVPVVPGSKTVSSRNNHWEIKANCYQSGVPPKESEDTALLPASELTSLSPSSYTCSSCSLPLVTAPPTRYRDLPSEHWEELIDAWMCHPEGQTLAKTGLHGDDGSGKANSFGFWPTRDEALVGGSYVLFDARAIASGNIKCVGMRETTVVHLPTYVFPLLEALAGFEVVGCGSGRYNMSKSNFASLKQPSLPRIVCWGLHKRRGGHTRLARCLCGAIVGRQHDRRQEDSSVSRMFRLFKYAIRPISTTLQVPKIPMGAFVLHDLLEYVYAHATYRFVLSDEEDEKPRLLIWLFKPRIRISYMLAAPALLPKSGVVDASKVLYKILGPSTTYELKEMLNRYPGFPQAEYLFYPMDVCRKLAALLKESTTSYPESMRTMTGLDVGWLAMTAGH